MSGVLTLLILGAASPGEADLAHARELVRHNKYPAALEALQAAEAAEGLRKAALCDVYELEGVVLAALKRPKPAAEAFKKLLALSPDHRLSGQQPKAVTAPYNQARDWLKHHGRLDVAIKGQRTEDDRVLLILTLSDPVGIASVMTVQLVEDGKPRQLEFTSRQSPAYFDSSATELEVTVTVTANHHQVLLTTRPQKFSRPRRPGAPAVAAAPSPSKPPAPRPAPSTAEPEEAPTPSSVREPVPEERAPETAAAPRGPWLTPSRVTALVLMGLGLVSGGVGIGFGARSSQGRSAFETAVQTAQRTGTSPLSLARATALDQDVRTSAWVANGLFAGAGVIFIVGALILAGGASVQPVLTPGGVALVGALP